MKANKLVSTLLEAPVGRFTAFQNAMAKATQELIADKKNSVHGGGRPDGRPVRDPYDINCGLCEEWGERVRELYFQATGQDDVEVLDPGNLSGDPDDSLAGHVFIRYQGKYYDAECDYGVPHIYELPLFKKQIGEALDPLEPNQNDDPEMARIRKRVAKAKADRLAQTPELQALDDPDMFVKAEVAKRSEPIKKLEIAGRRWYRRGAGGVYCKAYIYINDKLVHVTPEQYGYGDHYLTLATDWLRKNGYIDLDERDPIWRLRDEKKLELNYYVTDVKRERDL